MGNEVTGMPVADEAATVEVAHFKPPSKNPRLVAFAEAVEAVVHYQSTPGSYPSTVGNMIA